MNLTRLFLTLLESRYRYLPGKTFFLWPLLAFFLVVSSTLGQQTPLITHYMFTNMAFNPGYAGSSGGICATGLIREQWLGFKDNDFRVSPESIFLTVDAPIKVLHGGVGGTIFQDKIGFFRNIGVKLGYAYRMELGPGDFSVGLQLGFQNSKIDFSKFIASDGVQEDPVLSEQTERSDMVFDISAGLYYRIPDKFYVGLSGDQFLQSKGKNTYYKLIRTYFLTAGYQWAIPNHPAFELQPSVLFYFDGAVFQFNLSALVMYNNKFYGGLGYRFQDAVSILVGMNIKSLRVGLSYDISTSTLSKYNSGCIEVMVSYCFKIDTDKFRKSYRNTRFL